MKRPSREKLILALSIASSFLLTLIFSLTLFSVYKSWNGFFNSAISEQTSQIKSMVEGTLSSGGDPVEAVSIYIQRSRFLKGATIFVAGRQIPVPGSFFPKNSETREVNVGGYKFKLYFDSSVKKELNKKLKLQFVSASLAVAFLAGVTFWLMELFFKQRLKLENEKKEKERIESISVAISAILHEVKNSLNRLNMIAFMLEKECKNAQNVHKLRSEIRRLSIDVEKVAKLRSSPQLTLKVCEAKDVALKALKKIGQIKDDAEFELNIQDSLIVADSQALSSALADILRNAFEAVREKKDKGKVIFEGKSSGDFYSFYIKDSAAALKERTELFRPFKSTKKKGFGIGLVNAKKVVEAHGGQIKAYVSGGYTVFEVKVKKWRGRRDSNPRPPA